MGITLLAIFIGAGLYIHFRGSVRHSFRRQLTSHTNLTAPYNAFTYLVSAIPNTPYIEKEQLADLSLLDDNWETIREEAQALFAAEQITQSDTVDDIAFNSFFRTGWGRFYLKWYGDFFPSGNQHCPKTIELLKQLPQVNAAMFASLPPGAKLAEHRDPFAGSLRYHLGLFTPNSSDCFIKVDGVPYHWKDGESVLFDETYIHTAENNTDQPRVILFCDVRRPLRYEWANKLNIWVCNTILKSSATKNVPGEKVGIVNRAFGQIYKLRTLGKRIKKWNRKGYYVMKYVFFALIIYLIFF
ncbi:MAG: aspartyl/asparaginyl beta-hydroxylase domain-containing protein [Arenicella sp.]